jgi:hypothetical protein
MKTKKKKPDPAQNEEKTEIWKQIIITAGVVIVALIGSWQAIAIVQLNNRPPTPAPSAIPVAATDTSLPVAATNSILPTVPIAGSTPTQPPPATNTASAKPLNLSLVNINLSKWYRLTNESLGKNYSLDHWAATKDIVMNTTGFLSGQYWGFKVSDPGYYTLASEYYGLDIFLNILTDNNNSLNLSSSMDNLKNQHWKVTSFNTGNCVRFTSQGLGDSWSMDLTTSSNIPAPIMAQTTESTTQCWHLTPVGTIK